METLGGMFSRYARFFAARGAKVVINDVSAEAAQAVVDEIVKGMSSHQSSLQHLSISYQEVERLLLHQDPLQTVARLLLRPWRLLVLSMYLSITLAFSVSFWQSRMRASQAYSIRWQIVQEYVGSGLGSRNRGTPEGCLLLYKGLLALVQAAKG